MTKPRYARGARGTCEGDTSFPGFCPRSVCTRDELRWDSALQANGVT